MPQDNNTPKPAPNGGPNIVPGGAFDYSVDEEKERIERLKNAPQDCPCSDPI